MARHLTGTLRSELQRKRRQHMVGDTPVRLPFPTRFCR